MDDEVRDEVELLVHEHDQAGIHYRHLENTRLKYLGFFFTVTLGSLGLALSQPNRSADLVVLAGVSWMSLYVFSYFILTCFMYIAIRRLGLVLFRYAHMRRAIRKRLGECSSFPSELFSMPSFTSKLGRTILSVQRSAELLLGVAAFASLAFQASIAVRVLGDPVRHRLDNTLPVVAVAVQLLLFLLLWCYPGLWRTESPTRRDSQPVDPTGEA